MNNQKKLEQFVETSLWTVRFLTIIPVFFGVVSVFSLFLLGSLEIFWGVEGYLHLNGGHENKYVIQIMSGIIGGIDLYLIGIVLMLFSFGIYELFISKLDIGRQNEEIKILEITSLDQLKDKILKVIVMVLVVGFFRRVMEMRIETPIELLYLAISILLISGSGYLLRLPSYSKDNDK